MKAFLYAQNGERLGSLALADEAPPQMLFEFGKQFILRGSEAHISDDEVEWLGWDYVEHGTQRGIDEDHDHKGFSEEKCVRCGWIMGNAPLNCQNDNTPHVFPSQLGWRSDGNRT